MVTRSQARRSPGKTEGVMKMPPQLQGSNTTMYGILAIISGSLGIFSQIWGAIHGAQMDPTATTTAAGALATGIGLVKAADKNQAAPQQEPAQK